MAHPAAAQQIAWETFAFDQRGAGASEPSILVQGRLDLRPGLSGDSAEARQRPAVVAATIRTVAPAAMTADFGDQVKRVFARLDEEPLRIDTPQGQVRVGKSEIQLLVTLQSGDLSFVETLPVLFDSLEKRVRLQPKPMRDVPVRNSRGRRT